MKPGTPPLQSSRLLDQLRERIRYMHYSLSTEKIYLYWVRFFIRWHGRDGQMKHPRTMGAPEAGRGRHGQPAGCARAHGLARVRSRF